ncbi:hypothetical protein KKG15_01100 [Patescibacteria group bacterium]|nr:hypothetical protein [Patescibacteria group bacterium]
MDMSDKNNKRTQVNDYITNRIKKLTEALYRVTDLYPDQEPLKWALRENAVYLYNNLMSITDMSDRKLRYNFKEVLSSLSQIINKLDLASLGGFISDINFEIIKKEYGSLKDFLENQQQFIFSQEELLIKPELPILKEKEIKEYKGQKILSDKTENRKQKIINSLKNNDKKTIKEISSIFEDISEKSIQRDLADLVKSGRLLANGEKRWRVYYLNPNFNVIDKNP